MTDEKEEIFVLLSLVQFDGNEHAKGQELHRGTYEECEKLKDVIPAVTYSGDKKPKSAKLLIVPEGVFDEAIVLSKEEMEGR
jgi:hypothetical protein